MTNATVLREALARGPFLPFTVRTASGREFRIPHPEHALVTPGGRTLIVTFDDDAVSLVDMLLIEDINDATPTPSPARDRVRSAARTESGGPRRPG